jgi:hypothetical protein
VPLLWPVQASIDTIKDTTEELRSIATQYIIKNKAVELHPAPSSSREVSPNIVIQDAKEGGKKRRKQRRQETATTADDDSGINKQASSSIVVRTVAVAGNGKHQAWLPTYHFKKLHEDICPKPRLPHQAQA